MKAFTDSYLIDSSENELDLAHSGVQPRSEPSTNWTAALTDEEKERLWRIRIARAAVKRSDEVPLPESGLYYQNMETRIMNKVSMIHEQRVFDRIDRLCALDGANDGSSDAQMGPVHSQHRMRS